MASLPSSPNLKDHGFTPRREFIRDPKPPPNSFSLLAISSSSFIRLYSFTPSVITSLNAYLRQAGLLQTYREDVPKQFFEFCLEGKPWSSPKSVASERLLIEILSVVSHHGYNFLSTLDYGRESDDRLALAFSRPAALSQSSSPSPTPIPPHNGSGTTLSSKLRSYPFALSFPSMTTLRVICPPLHSTPAILQAVRSAWPRGVEGEKKIGDNCFEFKLKGYKWFHEDTFSTDSLQHILSLLSALDAHGFELQTSISLTNTRSRVKDLWIFTGPSSVDDFTLRDSLSALRASPEPSRLALSPDPFGAQHTAMQSHRRLVTDPLTSPRPASPMRHGRAVTDDPHAQAYNDTRTKSPVSPTPSNLLRKPAPRAQVPVSVHDDGDHGNAEGYRTILPSTIPSGVENMTGVGAVTPDVFYSTSLFAQSTEPAMSQSVRSPSPDIPPDDEPPLAQVSDPEPPKEEQEITHFPDTGHLSGPLLSPSAFRDSAVSATTDVSAMIPIKWTGQGAEHMDENDRIPSTPMFPGGWQPTPVYEKDEQLATETPLDIHLDQDKQPEQPIQDVRVASPQMMDGEVRQSEVGLIISSAGPLAPLQEEKEEDSGDGEAARRQTAASSGQGWVLVNVEAQSAETAQLAGPPGPSSQGDGTAAGSAPEAAPNPASQTSSPLPPAAKAIVIIDAVESKKKPQSSSRIKRFLSITRKDSSKEEDEKDKPKVHSRTLSMGQKLRQIGTPEAMRNEDKRRSFD
ncbi:hypothetical protein D9758_000116 [Tetrapyrgos nigripes]|uniref:Uncharacterized protein n=1 Tax=Tetrapyrgos nigripes TaxID=182062 RepID=A0A8H5H156_9AGAR|nr:hypothetical protein D9758_000116 [Tetrapyrgos nigripes]